MSQRDHRQACHRGPRFISQNQNDHCPLVDRKSKVYEQLTARKNRESVQALKAAEIAFPVTLRFLLRVETVKYLKNIFNGSLDGEVSVNGFRVRYTLEEDASEKSPEGTLTFCGHLNSCLTLLETWDYEFFKPDQFWNEYYGGAANLCIKTRHLVHEKVVGMLIGVRGSQVDNLSFQHDCDIQVFGLTLPKSSERVACVVGRISDTVRVIRDMYLTILAKPNELLRHVLHYNPSNYIFNVSKEGGGVFENQSAERQRLIQSRGPQHRRRHNASQRSNSAQLKRTSKGRPSRESNLAKPVQKQVHPFVPSVLSFQPPPQPPPQNTSPIPWTPMPSTSPGQNFPGGPSPQPEPPRNDMPMLMMSGGDRTFRPFRPPMPVGGPSWVPRGFLGPPPPPSPIQHPQPPPVPSHVALGPFGQPRVFSKPPKTNLAKYPSVFRPLACPTPPRFPPSSVNAYPGPPVPLPPCDVRSELSVTPDPVLPIANRRLLKEETLYIISPQRTENNSQLPSDLLLTGATWFRHRNHLHNLGITSENSLKLSCSLLGSENGPNDQNSLKILSKCVGDVKEWFFDESELTNLTNVNKTVEQVLHSRPAQKNARDFWSKFSGKLREVGRPLTHMKSRSFSHLNNSRLRPSVSAKSVPVQPPVVKTSVSQDRMTSSLAQEKPVFSSSDVRKYGLTFTSEVLPEKVTEEVFCVEKTEIPSRRGSSSGAASVDWDESLAGSDVLEKHSEDSGVHSDEPESSSRSQASEDGGWTEVISSRKCAMRVSVSSRNNKSSLLPRFVHSETASHHPVMSDLRDQYCKHNNHSFFFGTNSLKSHSQNRQKNDNGAGCRAQRSNAAPMGYARSGGAAQPVLS